MKNAFHFILKAIFVVKIITILFWLFDHVVNRLDEKARVNLKIYVTDWKANNYNTYISPHFKKCNQKMKIGRLIEYNVRKNFLQKSCRK